MNRSALAARVDAIIARSLGADAVVPVAVVRDLVGRIRQIGELVHHQLRVERRPLFG
jgi:hypothetical protein